MEKWPQIWTKTIIRPIQNIYIFFLNLTLINNFNKFIMLLSVIKIRILKLITVLARGGEPF